MNSDERRKLGRTGNPDHAKFAKPSPLVDLRGEKTVPACNLGDVRAWFGSFRQNGALLVRAKAPAPLRAVENLNSRIRHRSSHRTNFRTKADLARFAPFAEGGLRQAHTVKRMFPPGRRAGRELRARLSGNQRSNSDFAIVRS